MKTYDLDNYIDLDKRKREVCEHREGIFPDVLVACEYSDTVAKAFRDRGWFAVTNDLLGSESTDPMATHLQGDILDAIDSYQWDLIILHPPCTALCVSGNAHYAKGKPKHNERHSALAWTNTVWNYARDRCDYVALENPVGVLKLHDGTKASYVQPYEFGHNASKKTGLWLANLPPLKPTKRIPGRLVAGVERWDNQTDAGHNKLGPSDDRWKERSRTYEGIACAMADQWTKHILGVTE